MLVSYFPGEILRGRILGDVARRPELRLPLGALLGLCLLATIGVMCRAIGMSFSAYLSTVQLILFAFFGYFLIDDYLKRDKEDATARPDDHLYRRSPAMYVVIFAVVISCVYYFFPASVTYTGDAYDHIGYVRTIMIEDDMAPAGVLAPRMDETVVKDDPRKGALHPLLATVTSLSRLDPWQVWIWLPVVLAPLAALAFLAFASVLLPGIGYVVFTMVLFLMFQGGLGREFLATVAYGQHLSLVFFWLLFVLAIRYGQTEDKRLLGVILALIVGGTLIHIDVLVHFVLMYGSFLVFYRVFSLRFSGVLKLGLASASCGLVVLLWKLSVSYQAGNFLHLHPQGLLYLGDIGAAHFIASPIELLKKNGLLFFMGMSLVPGLFFIRKHRRLAMMSLALSAVPILIALNPWIAPIVYRNGGYLLHRFLLNVPGFVIMALVLGSVIGSARQGNLFRKAAAFLLLFMWAKVFLLGFGSWHANTRAIRFNMNERLGSAHENVVSFINENTPKGSVILSDPITSYMLSAFTHGKVVAVLHQHGNPNDPHAFDRLNAIRTALSPKTTQIEAVRVVDEYAVDYVLLNGSFKRPVHDFLADWDSRHMDELTRKFGTLAKTFKPVYEADGIVLYQVLDERPEAFIWFPEGTVFKRPDVEWSRCEENELGPLRIVRVSVDPSIALAGEKVRVSVAYEKTNDTDALLPLRLYIRLEDGEYFDSVRSYPGDKYVRRYRERRDAAFRRFSIVHVPFDGFYTPELWPHGREVYETFTMQLPTDLDEKTYDLQLRLSYETLVPNFSIRDLIFNDDSFVGAKCAELTIRRVVTR